MYTFLKFVTNSNKHFQCAQILNSNTFFNKNSQGSLGKWLILKLGQGTYKMKHSIVLKKQKDGTCQGHMGANVKELPKTNPEESESKNNIALNYNPPNK